MSCYYNTRSFWFNNEKHLVPLKNSFHNGIINNNSLSNYPFNSTDKKPQTAMSTYFNDRRLVNS